VNRQRDIPPDSEAIKSRPHSFVRFREYVRRPDAPALEPPRAEDGVRHAWLPADFFVRKNGVSTPSFHVRYEW
jgi:hypothetical protein